VFVVKDFTVIVVTKTGRVWL